MLYTIPQVGHNEEIKGKKKKRSKQSNAVRETTSSSTVNTQEKHQSV